MRKKLIALLLAMAVVMTGISTGYMELKAAPANEDYGVSYLALEDAVVGYANLEARGVYLMSGYSSLSDAGNSRVCYGGQTNAAKRCSVSVNAIIEKKVNGSWTRVDSIWKDADNAITVTTSKYLYVTSGYYYRVRSTHIAGTDSSASYTDALYM